LTYKQHTPNKLMSSLKMAKIWDWNVLEQ